MAAGDANVALTTTRAFKCNVFDGVNDYVEIPHNANQIGVNLSKGFTISAWIYAKSLGELAGKILTKGGTSGINGFFLGIPAAGNTISAVINNGTARSAATGAITYQKWYNVIVTISSLQLCNFYIDGIISGNENQDLVQGISAITSTAVMRIGNQSLGTDRTFDGGIKDVKMWDRVLTSEEIIIVSEGGTPPTPIHHFKLGGDYTDYGSVGTDATNSGSVVQIVEDNVAVAVKAQRVTANDIYMIAELPGGRIITAVVEET